MLRVRGSPHGRSGVAERLSLKREKPGASGQRIDWQMLPSLTANDQGDRSRSVGIAASFALKTIAVPNVRVAAQPYVAACPPAGDPVEIDYNRSITTAGCDRLELFKLLRKSPHPTH